MTKILLVEDDKSLREIYGVRLMAEGYEITSAGDGEEALAMAIKERPDLIVSDVMMPKISGFDMLDILRSTTETKDVKVIMMTALSSDDQRARGEALGADRYLVKSQVGIEDVVRTVHDVLGDGVSTPQTAAQSFGTPALSAVAQPVSAPIVAATPIPAPISFPDPVTLSDPATMPTPLSVSASSAPPVINTPPEIPPSAPAPLPTPEPVISAPNPFQSAPNTLPQPTAPFGSSRPGSLGDRVISPLSEQPAPVDMANLMSQELSGAASAQPPVAPTPPVNPLAPPAPQV